MCGGALHIYTLSVSYEPTAKQLLRVFGVEPADYRGSGLSWYLKA